MFRDNYGGLYAYALRRASPEDAEEVVAETFVVAWRRWDDAPRDHVRPWLYGIARRILANQRRGRARQKRLLERMQGWRALRSSPAAEAYGIARSESEQLYRAWRQLRPEDRELLLLAAWEQLDHHGIAEVVGCSPGTARVRLHRARKRLRSQLDRLTGEAGDDGGRDG